ncbi:MAG TPA: porin [Aquabacterium sp.]|uniref:porin n=1 Tax=Aquabacterium sp. TaxID=1872578 RepID=UPI002E312110|nr:porin [Aquabacterium sp.]HEX5371208.1 porin [Aquabacterium sp.]
MKAKRFGWQAVAAAAMMAACAAHAEEGGIQYKVSGFGTIAATAIDKSDLQFRTSLTQSKGAGSTIDLGADSRFGLQGVVNFGQGWSATAQLLSIRRRVDSALDSNRDFDIGIEWLFAQYAVTPSVDLRLGRVVLPAFMISDSRNVGYSQPWLRAPLEVYGRMPLTTMDGLQGIWRIPVGDAVVSLQGGYGKSQTNISSGATVIDAPSDWVASVSAQLEWSDWLLRAGQVRSASPFSSPLLAGAGIPTPIEYTMRDKFTNVGLQYDNGTAIVMAEWASRDQNDLPMTQAALSGPALGAYQFALAGKPLAKEKMWYVGAGWRFGKWLPMLTHGKYKSETVSSPNDWSSTNVSVRYDIANNVALKAQIGRHEAKDSSSFVTAVGTDTRSVTSVAFGVDFVF